MVPKLGANHNDAAYAKDGLFKNIPFKVCRNTADCMLREPLVGLTMALVVHTKFDANAAKVCIFEGVSACSGGKCFIRLKRIGATCPMPNRGLTFVTSMA
ncbi:hypothetical protein BDN71DRAFT_894538 [Pleurotus eryngii]|uniref:Uncharacterized protein n=1 Tax=Pleurotus eryngii TaxID=5323 RepID=A0A9P5ZWE2_PLEER|nr:hypothetical protein BDN71DRAFT_894538 [Pleurotus eryngii]